MELSQTYLLKFEATKKKPRNEREELLQNFLDRLNVSRAQVGLRPLTFPRIAQIFHGVPDSDLYPFYNECDNAKNFSKLFWWSVKKREAPKGNNP